MDDILKPTTKYAVQGKALSGFERSVVAAGAARFAQFGVKLISEIDLVAMLAGESSAGLVTAGACD